MKQRIFSLTVLKNSKFVIPNEVRDLLFVEMQEKADSSGKPRPRNDTFWSFLQTASSPYGVG
jgi:hypothetical protein